MGYSQLYTYHLGSGEQKELKAEIALFAEEAPMSVMNFLGLCRGYNKKGVRQQAHVSPGCSVYIFVLPMQFKPMKNEYRKSTSINT